MPFALPRQGIAFACFSRCIVKVSPAGISELKMLLEWEHEFWGKSQIWVLGSGSHWHNLTHHPCIALRIQEMQPPCYYQAHSIEMQQHLQPSSIAWQVRNGKNQHNWSIHIHSISIFRDPISLLNTPWETKFILGAFHIFPESPTSWFFPTTLSTLSWGLREFLHVYGLRMVLRPWSLIVWFFWIFRDWIIE